MWVLAVQVADVDPQSQVSDVVWTQPTDERENKERTSWSMDNLL